MIHLNVMRCFIEGVDIPRFEGSLYCTWYWVLLGFTSYTYIYRKVRWRKGIHLSDILSLLWWWFISDNDQLLISHCEISIDVSQCAMKIQTIIETNQNSLLNLRDTRCRSIRGMSWFEKCQPLIRWNTVLVLL